jgi:hypothetical protein
MKQNEKKRCKYLKGPYTSVSVPTFVCPPTFLAGCFELLFESPAQRIVGSQIRLGGRKLLFQRHRGLSIQPFALRLLALRLIHTFIHADSEVVGVKNDKLGHVRVVQTGQVHVFPRNRPHIGVRHGERRDFLQIRKFHLVELGDAGRAVDAPTQRLKVHARVRRAQPFGEKLGRPILLVRGHRRRRRRRGDGRFVVVVV